MKEARIRLVLEELESRDLLSAGLSPFESLRVPVPFASHTAHTAPAMPAAGPVRPTIQLATPHNPSHLSAARSQTGVTNPTPPAGTLTPDQVRHAYGFDQVPFLMLNGVPDASTYNSTAGKGQTIAIVDVSDDPNILSDANVFSSQFGLPLFNQGSGSPTFTKLNENGSQGSYPRTNSSWAGEISLDVEWAHAIAPQANIVLVEANSQSTSDVFKAINAARNYSGVSVVSMSWGYNESNSSMQKLMASYDSKYLTTPAGHTPITFVAATLDNGSQYGVYWPAISPNVLAVGGTVLTTDAAGNYLGESGWNSSTGGISKYEAEPSWQKGVVPLNLDPNGMRTNPDVSYAATNFAIYDTVPYYGQTGWFSAGGTSAGTPQWAALIALADQGRAAQQLPSLDGASQTLPALYQLAQQQFAANSTAAYFHDIVGGSNGAYTAIPGYDLVTGIGTPMANQLIPALAAYA